MVFLAVRRFRCRTFKGTHVHQATLFTHHLRLISLAAVIGARALPVAHAGESQKISPHMHYGGGTMVEACDSETNDSTTFILIALILLSYELIFHIAKRRISVEGSTTSISWRPGSNPAAAFERRGACSPVAYSLELRAAA